MKKLFLILLTIVTVFISYQNFRNKRNQKNTLEKNYHLVIYSPHPLSFIEPLINRFEIKEEVNVKIVSKGSLELLKLIKENKNSVDIMWGGSLSILSGGKNYFKKYISKNEEYILEKYRNIDGKITRFTAIPSILMINKNLIGNIKIEGFEDLLNPKLKGKIAMANPETSSSSFEHLINQLYAMGGNNNKGWDYIRKLIKNMNGEILNRSSDVYKGVVEGKYIIGCTFEEIGARYLENGAPIKIVYPKEGTAIIPDGVAIIKNSKNIEVAKKFIDFLTSKEIQEFISTDLNRRSIRKDVKNINLKSESNIKIISYNLDEVLKNKQNILNRYNKILLENR